VPSIDLVVPGDPNTATGGYIYDREILDGLAALGWRTAVHSLDDSFPRPTPAALRAARGVLAAIPDGSVVVIDGLALAGLERVLDTETKRLAVVGLVHHPLALETGVDEATARLLETAERAALALVKRVIVTSQWTARALGTYRVAVERIRVVEPGVDRRTPVKRRADRRADDSLNLLCVATLTPRKGHAVLFEALADLRDRRWHLTCAGSLARDAATAAALERQLDRLALRARVSLLGDLDAAALEREYARADLFVLASYLEGYGMALAEALARGVPVVSTTAGAIPETVPAAAGVLVPPGDSRALARARASLMDDRSALERLARAARAARATLPTWGGAAEKFAAALDGVAAARA
jgi:glycosyltransferase involved in cell wall biosynthesis